MAPKRGDSLYTTYTCWLGALSRGRNPNNPRFKKYLGRGITICERWGDFENFLADMGPRPSAKHSLDRIDNNGPYAADNCRWATNSTQQNNKSNNLRITYKGETLTAAEWGARLGCRPGLIHLRHHHGERDPERLLRPPRPPAIYTYGGVTMNAKAWAARLGIKQNTLSTRVKAHGVERALSMPKGKQKNGQI